MRTALGVRVGATSARAADNLPFQPERATRAAQTTEYRHARICITLTAAAVAEEVPMAVVAAMAECRGGRGRIEAVGEIARQRKGKKNKNCET